MTRRIWIVLLLPIALLMFYVARPAGSAKLAEAGFRSMYVMRCMATVERLDIVSDRVLESFALDEKTRKQRLIPDVAPGKAADGCLTYGAAYDRARSVVFTVVPEEAEYGPEGTQHFRVLGFHLPDFELVETVQIEPALEGADPFISFQHGQLQVGNWDGHLFSVPTGVAHGVAKLVSIQPRPEPAQPDFSSILGNPQAKDLDRFAEVNKETGGKRLSTWVLKTSGGASLVHVIYGQGEKEPLVIAVIHGRRAAVLAGLPQTLDQNVHLTPGGQYVYVEEALPPLSSIGSRKTGRVALFEAATGKMIKTWTIPGIQGKNFLAFTPTGKVIYFDEENYAFEPIAPSFPDLSVEPVPSGMGPTWFFTSF